MSVKHGVILLFVLTALFLFGCNSSSTLSDNNGPSSVVPTEQVIDTPLGQITPASQDKSATVDSADPIQVEHAFLVGGIVTPDEYEHQLTISQVDVS